MVELYHESQKEIPVIDHVDVVVLGGGPAGISAAFSAAKAGANVMLIERNGFLGGTGTAGMMEYFGGCPYEYAQGTIKEVFNRLENLNALEVTEFNKSGVFFDCEIWKYVAMQMLAEAGVKLKLYTLASAPILKGSTIQGVIIEGKSGRQAIYAKVVIDASGDADIAAMAGCHFQLGRETDGKMRPITLLFRVGGVDLLRLHDYVENNLDQFGRSHGVSFVDLDKGIIRLFGFHDATKKGRASGDLDNDLFYLRTEGMTKGNTAVFNTTRVHNVNGASIDDLTVATSKCMKQVMGIITVLRKFVPGFENAMLMEFASNLGVRQTRMLQGEYIYTVDDVLNMTWFDDTLCTFHRYGIPNGEQHTPDGKEGSIDDNSLRGQETAKHPAGIYSFHIPYRILVPIEVDNLLVAGRSISATHLGGIWYRGMSCCLVTGQIAGVAAAVAVKNDTLVRHVDIDETRQVLINQGIVCSPGSADLPIIGAAEGRDSVC